MDADIEIPDFEEYDEYKEEVLFEEALAKKISAKEASKKAKREKKARYYLDPVELDRNLSEHVILKRINPDHVMKNELGRNIIKVVDETAKGGQFRGYYNGWKEDMKVRAYDHICRYCHSYKIGHAETAEFMQKWLFRKKITVLESWFAFKGLDYARFYNDLPVERVSTPNGKEPFKMCKVIREANFEEINKWNEGVTPYNKDTFIAEILQIAPQIEEDYVDQKSRNPFNYLTRYVYNAFIAVIKEENLIRKNSQVFEENIRYKIDEYEDKSNGFDEPYVTMDESMLSWTSFDE